MSGTVNIARALFHDDAFKDQPFTEREAFMWLVMEASWKDRTKRVGAIVLDLKRGQLAASVRFMAGAWKWEKSTVDRFLKRLEKRDMIGTDSGTGINLITIRKYNDYQGGDTYSGTAANENRDSSGTAAGQTRTPDATPDAKREANASPKKSRGTRLPGDWFLPVEWGEWALSEGLGREAIRSEADKFKDYWNARAGPNGVKLDWQATWRNWIRSAKEKMHVTGTHRTNTTQGTKRPDPALEQIARLAGLGATPGDGRGGTRGAGEEDGSLWLGARPQ